MTTRLTHPSAAIAPQQAATPWWRTLWVLVLGGGVLMGLALGVRHVQGLFLLPIIGERGWTRETFGFAMAVQNLTWGLAQPFTGMLADRYGSWKVMAGGLVLYAAGLYGMTQADTSPALVWSAGVCIGIALSGTTFGVVYGARGTGGVARSGLCAGVGAADGAVPLVVGGGVTKVAPGQSRCEPRRKPHIHILTSSFLHLFAVSTLGGSHNVITPHQS